MSLGIADIAAIAVIARHRGNRLSKTKA